MADQLEYPLGMDPAAREPRESTVWIKIADEAMQVGSIPAPGGDFVFEVVWADLAPLLTKNRVESTLPESAWEHMAERAYARDFDELERRLDERIEEARTIMDRVLATLQVPPDPMPGPTPPAPESVTMADVDEILERIGAGIAARGAAMDRVLANLASNGPD